MTERSSKRQRVPIRQVGETPTARISGPPMNLQQIPRETAILPPEVKVQIKSGPSYAAMCATGATGPVGATGPTGPIGPTREWIEKLRPYQQEFVDRLMAGNHFVMMDSRTGKTTRIDPSEVTFQLNDETRQAEIAIRGSKLVESDLADIERKVLVKMSKHFSISEEHLRRK